MDQHRYHLVSFPEYKALLEGAGFADVQVQDITSQVSLQCGH